MYPYQNQPSHSGQQQHGPSSSQPFLENMETAASRFKRAFGRKRPSRANNEHDELQQGTQSDAPMMRKMTPVSRISQFIPRKDPKSALQAATSSFQALGQRLNKPLPPRVPSQIGPPPDLDLSRPPPPSPSPPPIREQEQYNNRRTSEEPRKSQSKTRSSPVPVNPKTVYRTSQLVEGPEISAAIEYMLDSPSKHGSSPPLSKTLEPASVSPPSPKVMRRGSYGKDSGTTTTTTTPATVNPTTKRRSMSLSMIPHFQANVTPPPLPSSSYQQAPPSSFTMGSPPPPANLTHQRSHSTLPTFTTSPSVAEPSAAKTDAYASGIITHMTPDKNSSTSSFKGKLSAWSTPPTTPTHSPSRPNRNPSPSHSHSKTASVVASFGPAATAATGLAVNFSKRAYEKVNSMWSGPASASPSSQNSGGGIQHGQHGSEPSGNMSRVKSRLNGGSHGGYGGSFSDVEPSRRRMGNSSSGSSAHPAAMQEPPIGPNLGTMLRPPFRRSLQNGGLVFGRPLADCVRDTKPLVVLGSESGAGIEARFIPALVLRCVQHIEQWGITEEGLFRISGRTSHINKLRAEFASGADYDLQMCGPGDLDPHAVASVLKAFLRELPEPILTRIKAPLYDAAFERAKDAGFMLATSSAPPTLGYNPSPHMGLPSGPRMGLPSGPRDTSTLPLRNRNALVPQLDSSVVDEMGGSSATPQQALEELVSEFRDLTWSLPRENRDLLLTITELLQKAAGESKTTKMPLSNLLLVLCPSMSMNPGVLKIFVEHHQEIFAEPSPPKDDQSVQSQVEPEVVVNVPELEPKPVVETVPVAPPTEIQNQVSPAPAQAHEEPKQTFEGVIPTASLPVRKQSLRRLAQGSQSPRTTPTSSPSAYKETFAADPSFNKPDPPISSELTVEQPRNSSRPTSPLRQSFSSSDLSRPAQPLGPRAPRTIPTPLTLQRERSNTPERKPSVSRSMNLRSASSLSIFSQEQAKPILPEASKAEEPAVEEPVVAQGVPELLVESQPILAPQNVDSAPPSSQGDVLEIPVLPDVHLPPPMTSSFANRRSTMPMSQAGQGIPSAGLSDGPSPVHTPQTADSGMSSQSNTITFPPSLPEVHSLPPMTSTFAQRKSVMPLPRTEETQASSALLPPSPDSAGNAVQPLTPLLAAMELENAPNASSFPPSPDPNQSHLRVEPLTLIKKRASQGNEPESAISSTSSAFTDSTDATFDQQLAWPEVPKTIPMVKPGYYAMLNQQTSSNTTLQPSSDQDTTAQFVTAGKRDSSELTAKLNQNNFPAELHDDDSAPISPDVPNGQYPPDPYSSVQPVPQIPDDPQPTNVESKARKDSSERVTVALSQAAARGKRMSSGDQYNILPSVDSTQGNAGWK